MNDNHFVYKGQKYVTGDRVTCSIRDKYIEDAKVSITAEGLLYVCQNQYCGAFCDDAFEYKYSWNFMINTDGSMTDNVKDFKLFPKDLLVSSIANIIGGAGL